MNKAELIAAIAADTRLAKHNVEIVLESAGRVIAQHFAAADAGVDAEAVLPGLGKLKATHRAARTGRNPQTGAEIHIPAKRAPTFTPAKALKDACNA